MRAGAVSLRAMSADPSQSRPHDAAALEPDLEGQPAPPAVEDPSVCRLCASTFVFPRTWKRLPAGKWAVLLRCPECLSERRARLGEDELRLLDDAVNEGTDLLLAELREITNERMHEGIAELLGEFARMDEQAERFVEALEIDAILPEDF